MTNVIETEGLTKEFDGLVAVDHVNLEIAQGEIFGLLGPNGAGKTTLSKMLCTLLHPASGRARVYGYDVVQHRDTVRQFIGIVFQDSAIDRFLTGKENLDFHARMYHMDRKTREERTDEVLELLDLKGKENIRISDCSGGIQRRFEVARGFMNYPCILFLDEPTLGLDVQTRHSLWGYIKRLNDEGTTIILTTHYIEEADYLCHRVAIIDNGRIVALDTPGRLKQAVGTSLISLQADGKVDDILTELKQVGWVKGAERHNDAWELVVDGAEERVVQLVDLADERGIAISSIELRQPTLEDAFLHYTGRDIREEEGDMKELWKGRMRRMRGRR
jgi:ABC-2 type transport system ATP-binding protein